MQYFLYLLLLSPLFLFFPAVGQSQGLDFHWERTDRTADGWMNGTGSEFDVAMTPGGVPLVSTPEGIFRIVEQTGSAPPEYVAELVTREPGGEFIGTIGERIYLKRGGNDPLWTSTDAGLSWGQTSEIWTSSDDGLSWERIIAEVSLDHITVVDNGSSTGSGIVAYDPEAVRLIIFSPTGQPLESRTVPIRPWGITASSSGAVYMWRKDAGMNRLFRSDNLGASWTRTANDGLREITFYSLLYAGDSVLIASTGAGLAASGDEGESWTIREGTDSYAPQGINDNLIVATRIEPSADDPDLFSLIRSVDAGQVWSGCGDAPTTQIQLLEDGSLYGIAHGILWRTDGCGSPWTSVQGDFHLVSVESVVSIGSDFLALVNGVLPEENRTGGGDYLMKSRDDGATWEPIMKDVTSILGLTDGGTLYISIERVAHSRDAGDWMTEWNREIFQSTDRGDTWRSLPELGATSKAGWPVGSLQLQGEEYVMMSRKGPGQNDPTYPLFDLLYSNNGGATFELIDLTTLKGGAEASYMQALLLPDGSIYGCPVGKGNTSTAFSRLDPRTGVREELPSPVPFVHLQIGRTGRLYGWSAEQTVRRLDSAGRLFRSDDGGESWTELVSPVPEGSIRALSEGADGMLYITLYYESNSETFQSSDGGVRWSPTRNLTWNIGVGPNSKLSRVDIDIESISRPDDLHLAHMHYTVIDTLQNGSLRRTDGRMLVYSTDGGAMSWNSAVDENLRDRTTTTYAVNNRGVIVAGTMTGGLYRTVRSSGVEEEGGTGGVLIDLW